MLNILLYFLLCPLQSFQNFVYSGWLTSTLCPRELPQLDTTEEILRHVQRQKVLYSIEKLLDLRYEKSLKEWQVLVKWQGFEDFEDSWEPVKSLKKDIPRLLETFLEEIERKKPVEVRKIRTLIMDR